MTDSTPKPKRSTRATPSGARPRRRSKKAPKKSAFGRYLLWLMLKIGFAFAVVLAIYLIYLDSKITSLFANHRYEVPAQVYARSLELKQGGAFTQAQLLKELDLLLYRKVERVEGPGQFQNQGNQVVVFRRSAQFADGFDEQEVFTVNFAQGRITSIYDHQLRKNVQKARMEPQLIQHFVSSQREDRELVRLQEVPERIKEALLIVEDRDFYEHHGVSPWAVLRAFFVNLLAGRSVQGGSTLTQQLAKNMYLTEDKTYIRKVNEALIALILDYRYSKDEILEAYINEIFLGQFHNNAVHGFGLGSKFYFGKPLNELRPSEYALLIGLLKGPSYFDPRRFTKRAQERRDVVLRLLYKERHLSEAEFREALNSSVSVIALGHHLKARSPAYLDAVKRELRELVPQTEQQQSGLKIYTYMDPQAQFAAEETVKKRLAELNPKLEAAMVVTDYQQGTYKAIVGGRDVHFAGYNRALDAKRQIGSIVKPILYLQALSQPHKYSLASLLDDSPLSLKTSQGPWSPRNFDKKFRGQVSLLEALSESLNVPTVRLGLSLGLSSLQQGFHDLGLERPLKLQPSAFLGAVELSPVEVAQLYQTLANKGKYQKLAAIEAITGQDGDIFYRRKAIAKQRVSEEATYLLHYAMQQAVRTGTGKALLNQFPKTRFAGKTGTSNDSRDSWFSGFDHESSLTIWLGQDDNKAIGLTGGSGALTLFSQYFKYVPPNSLFRAVPADVTVGYFSPIGGYEVESYCDNVLILPKIITSSPVADCD